MRVGIDARLIYYHNAGIGQYISNLTQALARANQSDEFVVFQSRKDTAPVVHAPNFRRQVLWTPSHFRFESWALSAELYWHSLDLLHSPDFIPPARLRTPCVITMHDLAFWLYPRFLTKESARYYGQVDRASRQSSHIIAVSQNTKQDAVRLLGVPDDKISVIYEAANEIYRPSDRAAAQRHVASRYGVSGEFILHVGTIEPRKNLPTLLQAYRRVRDAYKLEIGLIIAGGKGWLWDEVDTLTRQLGLTGKVLFPGNVPRDELVHLYNAARLFVFPSFYEGFGLPPLEAMACGTPVVVSNTSSLPEVVGDAGLLVDPNDAEAWAAEICRVAQDDKTWREMREKGLRRAGLFSWERAARETLDVYRNAARH